MLKNIRWIWPIVGVSIFAGYYYFIGRSAVFNFADEGYLYYLSWAMGEGKLPFHDFELTSYPPGLFALYALIFKLLGTSIESGRIMAAFWMIANVSLSYLLVREFAGRRIALLAALIIGLVPGPWHKAYIGSLCLAALLLAIRIQTRNAAKDFVLMSVLVALSLQLRLDAAVCTIVLLLIAIWRAAPFLVLKRHLLLLIIAMALTMFPLMFYLGSNGLSTDYANQLLNFAGIAAKRSASWYRLPSPSFTQLFKDKSVVTFPWIYFSSFLIPIALLAFTLKVIVSNRFHDTPKLRIALLITVWALLNIPQYAFERPDAGHLYQRGFALVIGACFLISGSGFYKIYKGISLTLFVIPIVIFLALYTCYGLTNSSGGGLAYRSVDVRKVFLPNGMQFIESVNGPWGKLATEIASHSVESDRLAAIPYAPGLNFVLKLYTPGRKTHYFPNVIRTLDDDTVAASDLSGAKFIALQPGFNLSPIPKASFACYAPVMTRLINSEFIRIDGFDDPVLLARKLYLDSNPTKNIAACESDIHSSI